MMIMTATTMMIMTMEIYNYIKHNGDYGVRSPDNTIYILAQAKIKKQKIKQINEHTKKKTKTKHTNNF